MWVKGYSHNQHHWICNIVISIDMSNYMVMSFLSFDPSIYWQSIQGIDETVYTIRQVSGYKTHINVLEYDLLSTFDLTCKVWSHWRDPAILQARESEHYYPRGRINRCRITDYKKSMMTIKREWISSDTVVTKGKKGEVWKEPWSTYKT